MIDDPSDHASWLEGGGEAGALVRSTDWSRTPLGPIASWPASLKTIVATMLHSRHPMFLWWGPELIQIYNDGYIPSFGAGKHPAAMGQRGADCWKEVWPIIWPQIDDVMRHGKASWNQDQLIPIFRNDRIEEVYWTYGYSPVFGESGKVAGTLVVCTETTARVVAERRLRALGNLTQSTSRVTTRDEMRDALAKLFADAKDDIPFALLYGFEDGGTEITLRRAIGLDDELVRAVDAACLPLLDPSAKQAPIVLPAGAAFIVRIDDSNGVLAGYVVFGLSPKLSFDDAYRAHLLLVGQHITRARARVEIEQARDALYVERNNLLMQAPIATALFRGPTHIFELANARYCRMVGRENLVGKTYLEAFPELASTALPGVLDNVYRTGEPFSSGEMLVPLDKGSGAIEECFFTFNLEALRDATGTVYGMMAVALEITDQVNARRAIEMAKNDRERLLADAQQASRAKDEFFAMLGHELRNPLAPIVTALHLMKQHPTGAVRREQEIIERQVGHLIRLVDDLLDVSKIARGKVTLRKEIVELSVVVASAIEIVSDLFEEHRHQLTVDVPQTGLRVLGDPVRLAQIVANLLSNAARYTGQGGRISVSGARQNDEVVLVVKDNGVGIGADLLPRVFDLFVQGRRNTDRKEGGLGLGLALVKSLVGLHDGQVVARSDGAGRGSEFEIRLPAREKKAFRASIPDSKETAKRVTPKRILVVDDNVDSAEMMRVILESAGHRVEVANDGPEALGLVEGFSPEIALLDIGLPVMDGYELGKRLHATKNATSCRLIALTGYGQEHDRAQSKASGFEAHLVKPVDTKHLLELIASEST